MQLKAKGRWILRIDFKTLREERITVIDKQIARAVALKKWTELAKLEAEKADLQNKIKQIEEVRDGRKQI